MSYFFVRGSNHMIHCPVCYNKSFKRQLVPNLANYKIVNNNLQCKKCNHVIMFENLTNIESSEESIEFNNS